MEYDLEAIRHRQKLFAMTMKVCFMVKLEKYHGRMVKYGIHIDYRTMECLTKSQSFEDNIELILCKSSATVDPRQAFKKMGNRLSLAKFFRWIFLLVQRTKAARILSHMNGVSQQEIKDIVATIGRELSVAYEYQLMMLHDDGEVIKLARHAVTCMMFYLNGSGSAFSSKDLLQAVLEVKPQSSRNKDILKVHPLYIDGKQTSYKWKVGQLFKQPGLRIEINELETELGDYATSGLVEHAENKPHDLDSTPKTVTHSVMDNVSSTRDHQAKDTYISDSVDKGNEVLFEDDQVLLKDTHVEKHYDYSDYQNSVEEREICLEEVSSVILGQNEHHLKIKSPNDAIDRRISTIEMDYELGKLHIEKHNISINDFSPVDKFADFFDKMTEEKDTCTESLISDTLANMADEEKMLESVDETRLDLQNTLQTLNIDPEKPDGRNVNHITEGGIEKPCEDPNVAEDDPSLADSKPNVGSVEKEAEYKFYGCFTPYGAKCRPEVYGFRGPIHVWDDEQGGYSVAYRDKVTIRCTYNMELPVNPGNPHQAYRPKTKVVDGSISWIS